MSYRLLLQSTLLEKALSTCCESQMPALQWLHAMYKFRFLALLTLFHIGCDQASDLKQLNQAELCTCDTLSNAATSDSPGYQTARGALLGTRFPSFEALKTVIQIQYDSTTSGHYIVRAMHCSDGRSVTAVLETGISQGDISKAKYRGTTWDRFRFLFRSPYAIRNRKDLEKIYTFSRWRPELFGEGDLAFYDIAKSLAGNINTPELAFKNVRDSTDKGYLNSFNHMTSQAFITTCFSEELADFMGDSHERYRHPELITGKFTEAQIADLGEGPLDNYVDIINNEWGQELGKALKAKYHIHSKTAWTPELLANYMNDLERYYSRAFQIGFKPYKPEDELVIRFSNKINAIMNGQLNHKKTLNE